MPRVTTLSTMTNGLADLQRRQRELQETQSQISSGKRVVKPSDDPIAAGRAERALVRITLSDVRQRALDTSRSAMSQVDTALGQATDLTQQAREIILQAGNSTYSVGDRKIFAQQLTDIRKQLLSVANRSDVNGSYLFGGADPARTPFQSATDGTVSYVGTPGLQSIDGDGLFPLTLDASEAWKPSAPGTLDLFAAIKQATDLLAQGKDIDTGVVLKNIDAGMDQLNSARAHTGSVLNRADQAEQIQADEKFDGQKALSAAQDLDLTASISSLQMQQTGYDAALKTYTTVQRMNLFQYLSG